MEKSVRMPLSVVGLVLIGSFTWFYYQELAAAWWSEYLALETTKFLLAHLSVLWVPYLGILLACSMLCLVIMIFRPLKPRRENGLIRGLSIGLLLFTGLCCSAGVATGFIWSLPMGFIWSFSYAIPTGIAWGLLTGLIIGPNLGLLVGSVIGLNAEFE